MKVIINHEGKYYSGTVEDYIRISRGDYINQSVGLPKATVEDLIEYEQKLQIAGLIKLIR